MVIESFSNPKYKYLLSLSKSKTRKKDGVFLMEGRPELDLALRCGHQPQMVIYCEAYILWQAIEPMLGNARPQVIALSKALFDSLSYQNVPNNFMCVFPAFSVSLDEMQVNGPTVVLENIEKPGNLGAILRTCDALGVKNLIVTESLVDLFNPNILRNSRGAVFTTQCVFTTNEKALAFLRAHHKSIYCAALSQESTAYNSVRADENTAFVFGSEAKGLSEFWLGHADQCIIIPMLGEVDSLNVSVSVAIILSHHLNQAAQV